MGSGCKHSFSFSRIVSLFRQFSSFSTWRLSDLLSCCSGSDLVSTSGSGSGMTCRLGSGLISGSGLKMCSKLWCLLDEQISHASFVKHFFPLCDSRHNWHLSCLDRNWILCRLDQLMNWGHTWSLCSACFLQQKQRLGLDTLLSLMEVWMCFSFLPDWRDLTMLSLKLSQLLKLLIDLGKLFFDKYSQYLYLKSCDSLDMASSSHLWQNLQLPLQAGFKDWYNASIFLGSCFLTIGILLILE